jgi:BMFP domain-containing protein YqiC
MSFMSSTGLDDLARRLADAVPESLRGMGRDLEANFKAVLQAQLAKLDLVSRTEFDVQAALLKRTQAALAAMEQRLKDLEAKIGGGRLAGLSGSRSENVAGGMSTVVSRAPVGLAAPLVRVEVHLGCGLPAFALVGLPETVVRESRERVRSAILTSGYEFPSGRITVNLSPADLPKEGGRFDLPIAIGILAASGQLPARAACRLRVLRRARAERRAAPHEPALPALIAGARTEHQLIVPAANDWEASWVAGPRVKVARHLREVCEALRGGAHLRCAGAIAHAPVRARLDISEVRGQFTAKRALEIAAAGCHAMLMIGPPGAGKTLLAQCLPGLLPPLDESELLEVASLASAAGQRPGASERPNGRFAVLSIRPRSPRSSAAAPCGPASSRSHTTACCFSMSCRSSRATSSRRCASRWRAAWSSWGERAAPASIRPDFN